MEQEITGAVVGGLLFFLIRLGIRPPGVTFLYDFPGTLVFHQQKVIGENPPIGHDDFRFGGGSIFFVIDRNDAPNAVGFFSWFKTFDVRFAGACHEGVRSYGVEIEAGVEGFAQAFGLAVGGAFDVIHERGSDLFEFRLAVFGLGLST